MYYSIFRNNELIVRVKPLDSSELVQIKQQEDTVRLNFELVDFVELKIGDYIVFEKTESKYILNKSPQVLEHPKKYRYDCIFEGGIHEFKKTKVFLDTPKEGGGFYRDYKFTLTGNAQTFLTFIIQNLNRGVIQYQQGIYKNTNTITVEFNNWNVFEAITELSGLLGFDWYLEGDVLNFEAKQNELAYVFQVGIRTGFIEIVRALLENSNLETVVYGFGSTKNLPPRTSEQGATYDSPVLSENRLAFNGEEGLSKLSNNTDLYGKIESVQEFDIYPEFTGAIESIIDLRSFIDTSINFNINDYLLEGIKPKITFLDGKLIGLTFDISFDNDSKKITMDYYSDESGQYPNDIIFAEVGNQYKIFDIAFPESYIEDAQNRLEQATQEYLDESSRNLASYTGKIDEKYILSNDISLNLGDIIRIVSATFVIDNLYEIKELHQNINVPERYEIKFGDILPKGLLTSLKIANFNTEQKIYNISKSSVTNNTVNNIINEELEWELL